MTKQFITDSASSVPARTNVGGRSSLTLAIKRAGDKRPAEEFSNANWWGGVAEQEGIDSRKIKSRKRRSRPALIEPVPLLARKQLTIKEMVARYGGIYTEPALRHLVYQAEAYRRNPKVGLPSNGFLACIIRPPGMRKVLIDAEKFEQWLTSRTDHS